MLVSDHRFYPVIRRVGYSIVDIVENRCFTCGIRRAEHAQATTAVDNLMRADYDPAIADRWNPTRRSKRIV